MKKRGGIVWLMLTLLLLVVPEPFAAADSLRITHVSREPIVLKPETGDEIRIAYRLSAAAQTTVRIFDARDLPVRRLGETGMQSAGDHRVAWDGRDENGRPVPPCFYTFVVEAADSDGQPVVHDLTDLTGGKSLTVPPAVFDSEKATVSYVLPGPSLVNIRVGLPDGGPLFATIVDWVARPGGRNEEPWDGWDRSRTVNLRRMQDIRIGVSAYELPANSIIVTGPDRDQRPQFIASLDPDGEKRPSRKKKARRMYNHWQHPRDRCYDPEVQLDLPDGLKRAADGTPLVSGPVPLTMAVAPGDRPYMLDQRFEVVFYVDFIFVYEEELGYTPFTWTLDPMGLNPGDHYVTVMLRGYEGHFGTRTIKIRVEQQPSR